MIFGQTFPPFFIILKIKFYIFKIILFSFKNLINIFNLVTNNKFKNIINTWIKGGKIKNRNIFLKGDSKKFLVTSSFHTYFTFIS